MMWLPQQDRELFNPAALEVKERFSKNELPTLQRLAEFVHSSGMGCGLIVVEHLGNGKELATYASIPYTFVIGLREFKTRLKRGELGAWLKRERNRLVHGVR